MDPSTMLAKISDPVLAMRLYGLMQQEAEAVAQMKSNPTDVVITKLCFAELRGIRRERAALSMVSAYNLRAYDSGPAVATALEVYYASEAADPALWARVLTAIDAFISEATGKAVASVAHAKETAAQAAEKTRQDAKRTAQMDRMAALEADESKARTEKMQREAGEADIRRRKLIFDNRNIFWRAIHTYNDVALLASRLIALQ
jgi:hypothetical protein